MFQAGDVALRDGWIDSGPWPCVDAGGYLVLPGLVDLLASGLEHHLEPGAHSIPLPIALRALDREAAAHGVTTSFLTQHWSWAGGARAPEFAETLLQALEAYRGTGISDLEVALICESHTVGTADRLLSAAARFGLRLVYFTDTLPAAQRSARDTPDLFLRDAARAGRTAAEHLGALEDAYSARAQVPRHLCTLASGFDGMGLRYGSVADADAETREHLSLIGARICALPGKVSVARAAHAVGDPILCAASGAQLGAHGAPSTLDLASNGLCNVLVSEHHAPSLAGAAFHLADAGVMPLADAWALGSEHPAQLVGLADRGRIAEGLRADLTVIREDTRAVEMTIAGGRLSYLSGDLALRFLEAGLGARALAAE